MRMTWTLAEVEARCEPEGECMLWTKATNREGYPVAGINGVATHMARFVFTELLGRTIPPGHRVTMKCRNHACLAAGCFATMTRGKILARSYANGARLRVTETATRRRLAEERGVRKLTEARAAEIRQRAHERTADLAVEFGVSKTTINKVKSGAIWFPLAPGASVFSWRPA
jgi:hypothetical protein